VLAGPSLALGWGLDTNNAWVSTGLIGGDPSSDGVTAFEYLDNSGAVS
jgi:hypothetical protein